MATTYDPRAARFLSRCEGLFLGQMSEDDTDLFVELRAAGLVTATYEGAAGLLGLGRVRRTEDCRGCDED